MIHLKGCARDQEDHEPPCRDKRDKPRILLPDGKTVRSYTRTSGYGKVLEDLNALMAWKCRMTTLGLLERPDLLAAAAAYRGDKKKLQSVVDAALEAGGATQQANRGSAVHFLTESVDRGEPLGALPEAVAADLQAYRQTLDLAEVEPVLIEVFCVQDDLMAAGTFDRVVSIEGRNYIADLKTSSSANYPHSWAIQLAIYAHSLLYDFETHQRSPLPDVAQDRAVLIHLPAEQARCDLYWIDIEAGWEAATELVSAMKAWRQRDNILTPF